jgi:hypothetical protein
MKFQPWEGDLLSGKHKNTAPRAQVKHSLAPVVQATVTKEGRLIVW